MRRWKNCSLGKECTSTVNSFWLQRWKFIPVYLRYLYTAYTAITSSVTEKAVISNTSTQSLLGAEFFSFPELWEFKNWKHGIDKDFSPPPPQIPSLTSQHSPVPSSSCPLNSSRRLIHFTGPLDDLVSKQTHCIKAVACQETKKWVWRLVRRIKAPPFFALPEQLLSIPTAPGKLWNTILGLQSKTCNLVLLYFVAFSLAAPSLVSFPVRPSAYEIPRSFFSSCLPHAALPRAKDSESWNRWDEI